MGACSKASYVRLTSDQVDCEVDGIMVDHWGRSRTFTPFKFKGPWFAAFHFSWFSFFIAFIGWFSIVPCLEYLIEDTSNNITLSDVKTSNIVSVLGTIFLRFALGPIVESFGPRRPQALILGFGGIMVMLAALINSSESLIAMRFFIGFIGGTFVPCQYWTTMMFGSEVVGQANAFAGGWGNLGGGVASLFVAALITGFQTSFADDVAWRYAILIPGIICLAFCFPMYWFGSDCPQGHWDNRIYGKSSAVVLDEENPNDEAMLKKRQSVNHVVEKAGPWVDWRVWILFLQYACCFGVELTINNTMTTYLYRYFLKDEPGCDVPAPGAYATNGDFYTACSILGKNNASMVASLFGLMNLFARALGGIASDGLNKKLFMRGRLTAQFLCLFGEGVMLLIFSRVENVGVAIFMLILFSLFVQSSEGSTFSIVPFMSSNIGGVAAIVGAGGNVGAVCWATMMKGIDDQGDAYFILGWIVLACSFLTFLIPVQGTYLAWGPNPSTAYDDEIISDDDSEAAEISIHRRNSESNGMDVSSL